MLKRSILLTAAVCCLCMISCDDEKESVETMISGFMTAHTDSEGYISVMNDDFGVQYKVYEKSEKLKPDTLYRLVASIAVDESRNAKIVQMAATVSYVAPEDSIIPDTLRFKDPFEIESRYIGGGYLNFFLAIKVKNEESRHALFYTHSDSLGKHKFTFYHNAYGDEQVYTKHAYVSIPLYVYNLAKNDTVLVSAKGYKEDYDIELIYK